jgi:hypothetical protein
VSISLRKPRWLAKGALALVGGVAFLASITTSARAHMGPPGNTLFTYYDVDVDPPGDGYGAGDSILRLVNPVGTANRAFGLVTDQCAMIYVFDNDEEMGACCGCPITPAQELSFSVEHNLLSNWIGVPTGNGVIAIRSAAINDNNCFSFRFPGATQPGCNGGCDPTDSYSTVESNFLGSMLRAQDIPDSPTGLTETSLFDDANGDPANNQYLINECAQLIGGGSGAGICSCPSEEGNSID